MQARFRVLFPTASCFHSSVATSAIKLFCSLENWLDFGYFGTQNDYPMTSEVTLTTSGTTNVPWLTRFFGQGLRGRRIYAATGSVAEKIMRPRAKLCGHGLRGRIICAATEPLGGRLEAVLTSCASWGAVWPHFGCSLVHFGTNFETKFGKVILTYKCLREQLICS